MSDSDSSLGPGSALGEKGEKNRLGEKKDSGRAKRAERSLGVFDPFFCLFPGVWGLFLEIPANFSGPESCFVFSCVCVQDQSFNNFENNTIEL